ncbi:MAG: SsrA-binding protein SmpB [Bdellovibrionaceae bacterium]|nr:SsrA-binding protein SmpB [Bdellovibrionales bacterium]MCB9254127.1 SsrA-binding protein SmpB [Pseudobdellovibrionaceae bacterium]
MKSQTGIKIICDNRKAFHNYSIEEKVEAGIVLKGTEVKALRNGNANLRDAYAVFNEGELFLLNAHIDPYSMGNRENHEPTRTRKLLLHREELEKLWGKLEVRGYSLVPLKMYFKEGRAKVELGLGKGKKSHDKRASKKEKDVKREIARAMKSR